MTYEQWWDTYKPVQNHLTQAAFDGAMFETYGEELEHVRNQDSSKIWTLVDGDDNNLYVSSGYHLVNRIGYFITEVPLDGNGFLEVPVYDEDELEEMEENE